MRFVIQLEIYASFQPPLRQISTPIQASETSVPFTALRTNCPVSGAIAPFGKFENALCALLYIVRKIKGFAATFLLKLKWLWPTIATHWLTGHCQFAPEELSVIIVVSEAQLDDSSPSAPIGVYLLYIYLTGSDIW